MFISYPFRSPLTVIAALLIKSIGQQCLFHLILLKAMNVERIKTPYVFFSSLVDHWPNSKLKLVSLRKLASLLPQLGIR